MQPISVLILIYSFITIGTAATLFFSFKGKFDTSALLFLTVEVLMLGAVDLTFLTKQSQDYSIPAIYFLINFLVISAEIILIFSVYSLDRRIDYKKLLLAMIFSGIYCLFIEYARINFGSSTPIAFQCSLSAMLAFMGAYACRGSIDPDLKQNQFLKLIVYLQIGLGIVSLIRLASFFTSDPIAPRNPNLTNSVIVLFAVYLTLNVFRYITYQSLRISWVNKGAMGMNFLNKSLYNLINEKEQLLQNLINSNRMIGVSALASSLSHELSQPLTSISLQTEAVKRDLINSSDNPKSINSLDSISSQINRLSALVKNLRQLFKSQNNQLSPISLVSITNELLEILDFNIQSTGISLIKDYGSNPTIEADPIQIQQVLINLLNNAIESIVENNSRNKEIAISISSNEKNAIISIQDTGKGIKAEILPVIFDLYKTSKTDGLGIGLWLSKTILDSHKGSITGSNIANGGAIFIVTIPLSKTES